MKKLALSILCLVVVVALLAYGIKSGQVSEVETNADYLCLSCIGIG
ncbi:MAG: hypothetical protein PHE49_03555 [bacterium]|jgi:hypothetical protein|nr:hypothetical protein [bacterium]